jgi:hypothetical protein
MVKFSILILFTMMMPMIAAQTVDASRKEMTALMDNFLRFPMGIVVLSVISILTVKVVA